MFKIAGEIIECPYCRTSLRKKDIAEKSREEMEFKNEMRIRGLLKLEFNEKKENFENGKDFNDYKEFIEDIVELKIGKGNDLEIKKRLDVYRKDKLLRKKKKTENERLKALSSNCLLIR